MRTKIYFIFAILALSVVLLMGFTFGEIPDLDILPPVCGVPSSKHVVFCKQSKNYFEVLDTKTNIIKKVIVPFDGNKISPFWSYDDYVYFQTEKIFYRYDIIKDKYQELPQSNDIYYYNFDTRIVVRNLGRFGHGIVHLQKEKYDPEKKTFTILKTWPKFIDSELVGNGNLLAITNKDKTFLIDVETGFEKTLKGSMKYCFRNDRQIFVETRGVYDGTHLYQIDLAFRGRTIDYAIIANSQILKDFTTGGYRRVGMNKKTGYLYSVFTNWADNSLEIITIENEKMIKKVYYLPKELPYKFIYEKEKNNFMEGGFHSMYGDLVVLYFIMDGHIQDTRFIFLDTKKYDQLPEENKKDSIVFEFKNEFILNRVIFYEDKFYIVASSTLYCYDYNYNLLWKKLCPMYFGEIKDNGRVFSCYSIFNNDTLLFDVYAKEYDENGNFKHNYYISPCYCYGNVEECSEFIPTKHGIFSIRQDTRGIKLARIRLFKSDIFAPAYDLVSKNNVISYTSWKYDGEDLITLEDFVSGKKLTEIFNIKLGQFVD